MPDQSDVRALPRSEFAEVIASIGDGSFEKKLSKVTVEVTDHLKTMGGKAKGKMVLTVEYTYDREMFEVNARVTTTLPQIPHPRTLMFPLRDGGLSRSNSNQMDAFAQQRDLPAPERQVRDLRIAKDE